MASDKKIRKPNLTDEEIRSLLESIGLEKECMQCKLQGSLTGRRKKDSWDRVLFKVNLCNGIVRTYEEIKKKWKDLKTLQPTRYKLLTIRDGEIETSQKLTVRHRIKWISTTSEYSCPPLFETNSRQYCDKYLTHPSNNLKPLPLPSLLSSFTPN